MHVRGVEVFETAEGSGVQGRGVEVMGVKMRGRGVRPLILTPMTSTPLPCTPRPFAVSNTSTKMRSSRNDPEVRAAIRAAMGLDDDDEAMAAEARTAFLARLRNSGALPGRMRAAAAARSQNEEN